MPMNSHTSLNDARLDRAIDRAVREMMQVDPAPGLRRRVLSRINAPVEHRTFPALRYGFAAAALAVVVLSITLMPGHVEPPAPPKAPSPIVATGVSPVDLEAVLSTSTVTVPRCVHSGGVSTNLKRTDPHASDHKRVWRTTTRRVSRHCPRARCAAHCARDARAPHDRAALGAANRD